MTTFLLVIALFNASIEAGQNIGTVVRVIKATHHHSTRPLYRHILKPVGKAVKAGAE